MIGRQICLVCFHWPTDHVYIFCPCLWKVNTHCKNLCFVPVSENAVLLYAISLVYLVSCWKYLALCSNWIVASIIHYYYTTFFHMINKHVQEPLIEHVSNHLFMIICWFSPNHPLILRCESCTCWPCMTYSTSLLWPQES